LYPTACLSFSQISLGQLRFLGLKESVSHVGDYRLRAKAELFGLAALMLRIMEKSADDGVLTHGGPAWKSFGRALWEESSGA